MPTTRLRRQIKRYRAVIASGVGLASEVFPFFGFFPAALLFPEDGIHSGRFVLAIFCFNFAIVAGVTYALIRLLTNRYAP